MSKMCAVVVTLHTWPKLVALKWVWWPKLHNTLNHKPFQLGMLPKFTRTLPNMKDAVWHEIGYKNELLMMRFGATWNAKKSTTFEDSRRLFVLFRHISFMRESSRVHISLLLCHALHEEELPLSLAAFLSSKIASISSLNVSPDPRPLQNLLQTSTKQEYVPHKSTHVLLLLLSLNSIGWQIQVIMHLQVGNSV